VAEQVYGIQAGEEYKRSIQRQAGRILPPSTSIVTGGELPQRIQKPRWQAGVVGMAGTWWHAELGSRQVAGGPRRHAGRRQGSRCRQVVAGAWWQWQARQQASRQYV